MSAAIDKGQTEELNLVTAINQTLRQELARDPQ